MSCFSGLEPCPMSGSFSFVLLEHIGICQISLNGSFVKCQGMIELDCVLGQYIGNVSCIG